MNEELEKRCKRCRYHSRLGHAKHNEEIICYYIAHTYKRRGCPIEDCDKFEAGRPRKIMESD